MSDFDLLRIRDETFVQAIDFHEVVDSTNTRACAIAADVETSTAPLFPILVLADLQTSGRGRGTNQWLAGDGALTYSLVLELPAVAVERIPQVSLVVGLSLCKALEPTAADQDWALKWPNDVYLTGRKLAGILIEVPALPAHHQRPLCVIGVGVNVNNAVAPSLSSTAISLHDAVGRTLDRSQLLIAILQQLETALVDWQRDPTSVLQAWQAYDYLFGRDVCVVQNEQRIQGIAAGLDIGGGLRIQQESGAIHICTGGVVASIGDRRR